MTDAQILKQFGDKLVEELKSVSKGFAPTIEAEYTETSLTIYASPFIRTLIDGRGPTRAGAKSGSPSLQQIILSWIERHSIQPRANKNGTIPTSEQLSWAISKSIHRDGTQLYQQGGGANVFDAILTQSRFDNLLNLFGDKYLTEIKSINV